MKRGARLIFAPAVAINSGVSSTAAGNPDIMKDEGERIKDKESEKTDSLTV
jgi:hypothetical protein